MRNYLFLVLAVLHIAACTQEKPDARVDPNSALGRREQMEERMADKLNLNKTDKDPSTGSH